MPAASRRNAHHVMQPPISGLILAGGLSRRFGSDKAAHRIDGQSMIEIAYDALRSVTDDIIISVRQDDQSYDLDAQYVVDRYRRMGPLAGLDAGLAVARQDWVFVVACDMPRICQDDVEAIIGQCAPPTDAVVATDADGMVHPLCGCYYRPTVAPRVKALLQQRHLSMMGLLDRLVVQSVPLSGASLFNVNRPADLVLLSLL